MQLGWDVLYYTWSPTLTRVPVPVDKGLHDYFFFNLSSLGTSTSTAISTRYTGFIYCIFRYYDMARYITVNFFLHVTFCVYVKLNTTVKNISHLYIVQFTQCSTYINTFWTNYTCEMGTSCTNYHNLLTYLLTTGSRVFLEKLTGCS
jgi:hypothetical protein